MALLLASLPSPARPAGIPAHAPANRVELSLVSSLQGRAVAPGEAIPWSVRATVTGPNLGLAAFSVDLVQSGGNPAPLDLPPGAPAGPPAAALDRPAGFTNPPPWPDGVPGPALSGFGGTPVARPAGGRDLLQIGGAQNVFGTVASCDQEEAGLCQGQAAEPETGIGRHPGGEVDLATGVLQAPDQPGVYRLRLARARAGVLAEPPAEPGAWSMRAAQVLVSQPEIRFEVVAPDTGPGAAPSEAASPGPFPPAVARAGSVVRPPSGAVLTRTHVRFWWPAVPGAGSYRLQVYRDDDLDPALADPLLGVVPVVDATVPSGEPRHDVTAGLEFGGSYLWQVTAEVGPAAPARETAAEAAWTARPGPLRRFSIAPLPEGIPPITVERPVPGDLSPGLTLYNLSSNTDPPQIPQGTAVAVDAGGRIVFYLRDPAEDGGRLGLVEQTPQGRYLMIRGRTGGEDLAVVEETVNGQPVWESPAGRGYGPHHDADILPDGDFLLLLYDPQMRPEDGGQEREGDRMVVVDRHSGRELWEWRTINHYDPGDGQRPIRDWTHGNAAHFDPATDSVYFSARSFSRITRIDFDSGEIIYNMGREQPSGDTDFGNGFFIGQHDPQPLDNGNLLVFDNGIQRSYVTEIAFNDREHPTDAAVVWRQEIVDPTGEPMWIRFANGAQRLPNGNTLYSACTHGRIQEIGPDGELLWSLKFGTGAPEQFCYRARKAATLLVDVPGDSDGDQDLDLADLMALMVLQGRDPDASPGLPFPDRLSDLDGDGRLDAADVAAYVNWQTGPVE